MSKAIENVILREVRPKNPVASTGSFTPLRMTPYQIFSLNPNWEEQKEWILEIGPGNGHFLCSIAASNPQKSFLAVEIRAGRFQKIAEKIKKQNLQNIILIHGNAAVCLFPLLKDKKLKEVYILFPDPWPKRRHHKHRLLQTEWIDQLAQSLKPEGTIWTATDHEDYARQISSIFPQERWTRKRAESLYPTHFETKWKKMGREIYYFRFQKC